MALYLTSIVAGLDSGQVGRFVSHTDAQIDHIVSLVFDLSLASRRRVTSNPVQVVYSLA